ncbi:protein BEAN1-like [Periophthalmus magnuspinnatus]|uniref:protein BEAN1-like n=1 Tax=Periophthalmus magnuspinnatus TaxID=409849 RepID=UPI002437445A|nr:protein BEAN1-like [Periophthalmus magnuspinnatus]
MQLKTASGKSGWCHVTPPLNPSPVRYVSRHVEPAHRYEECVGPGATEIYIPTDDPPPYSLLDPCQEEAGHGEEPNHTHHSTSTDSSASTSWFSPTPHCLWGQHITSLSYPMEEAPPYESVLMDSGQPLPLMPCDLYKHQSEARGEGRDAQLAETSQIL